MKNVINLKLLLILMKLLKYVKPLPFLVTLVTSVLLFIKYLISIGGYSFAEHLHVWFGLIFLVLITQKMGSSFKDIKY